MAVNSASAHPHIDSDGTLYNLGSSRLGYTLIKIPPTGKGWLLQAIYNMYRACTILTCMYTAEQRPEQEMNE